MIDRSRERESSIRVLFYEPYPMGLGGNFVTQRLILERLDRAKFNAIVVAPIEGPALEVYRAMGVECVVIPPPPNLRRYGGAIIGERALARFSSALDLVRYNIQLAHFLRESRIAVVYANCVRALMSAGLAARLARVPSLLYVKGELANPVIDRICFVLASRILFFCEQNRDDRYPGLVQWFRRKIGILGIGLDPKPIEQALQRDKATLRRDLGIDPDRVNVVVLGQLYRPKGQHFVVEALAKVVAEYPQVRVYFVGDHVIEEYRDYRRELEARVARLGLQDYVRFTGWRQDALNIVAAADLVIHPSLAEGFGRAVLESMALGRAVIASRVGGLREIIEDGRNGFLVEPGDVDAIAYRWKTLLADPDLRARLGREARCTVYAHYLIDDKVAQLSETWATMAAAAR